MKPMNPQKAAYRYARRRNQDVVKGLRAARRWSRLDRDEWVLGDRYRGGYSIVLPAAGIPLLIR